MAREVHAGGMRERNRMSNHTTEGTYDLGWRDNDGGFHHICRYSSEEKVLSAKERLRDPDEQEQNLIGVPANPTLEIIER